MQVSTVRSGSSGWPSATATPAPTPTASRTPGVAARPTRVVIAALGIDLAVVKAPSGYPLCNVAMYFPSFGLPGEARATYIFAHARDGMFGPIYELSMVKRTPDKMVGMEVLVYTANDQVHVYKVIAVRRHITSLDAAWAVKSDRVFLQTSEGPHGTPGKTQVIAAPVSVSDVDHATAHPKPRPVVCG
ncbi:MAG: sortase [Chloroflexota bacterium]